MQKSLFILSALRLTESVNVGTDQQATAQEVNEAMTGSEANRLAQIDSESESESEFISVDDQLSMLETNMYDDFADFDLGRYGPLSS